jgi:hypothetical protein
MADKILYIKVSKIDGDGVDQTFTLQTLQQITIPWGAGNSTETFEIFSITEFQDHFLYGVNPNNVLDPVTVTNDRAKIEYDFSSSVQLQSDGTVVPILFSGDVELYKMSNAAVVQSIPLINTVTDNLGFYVPTSSNGFLTHIEGTNPDGAYYQVNTYPQKSTEINFSGSFLLDVVWTANTSTQIILSLIVKRQNGTNILPTNLGITSGFDILNFNSSSGTSFTSSFHLSMSYGESSVSDVEALPDDKLFAYIVPVATNVEITGSFSPDTFFNISSSAASGPSIETIPEPFLSENFSNAFDCQPLYGNVSENQTSYKWMKVDHTTGIMIPINFDLIINGGALKAQVQDSNYSSLAHITPRYLGSKNTSRFLNVWNPPELSSPPNTPGNEGNYGKTPSVDSKKTIVTWASFTSGWAPEKMNRSKVKIKYLIDETGKALTPNASSTALDDVQNIFRSGENVILTSYETANPSSFTNVSRIVDRGGTTIEPILYNQVSHYQDPNTPMSFLPSITINDALNLPPGILDFRSHIQTTTQTTQNINVSSQWTNITLFNDIIFQGSSAGGSVTTGGNSITIPSGLDNFNGDVTFKVRVNIANTNSSNSSTAYFRIYNQTTGVQLGINFANPAPPAAAGSSLPSIWGTLWSLGGTDVNSSVAFRFTVDYNITVSPSTLTPGDEYVVQAFLGNNPEDLFLYSEATDTNNNIYFGNNKMYFKLEQTPLPTSELDISGGPYPFFNPITTGYNNSPYPALLIYTGSYVGAFEDPNMKQEGIPDSGFNDIKYPIEIKVGDEIRFEGYEDKVVTVIKTLVTSSYNPTQPTLFGGVVAIYVDKDLTTLPWNTDEFLVRRYVDNPGEIIISRDAIFESQGGPLLVKPDYITNQLNENLDDYITNLTNKGLL